MFFLRLAFKRNKEVIANSSRLLAKPLLNRTLGSFSCPALLASSLPGRLAKAGEGENGSIKSRRKARELTNEKSLTQLCAYELAVLIEKDDL